MVDNESDDGQRRGVADPILLVAHGSPDPDWREPLDRLEARIRVLAPGRQVRVVYLDHLEPSLGRAARELVALGHRRAVVVAAFLSPGGNHIKRDIPRLVEQIRAEVEGIDLVLVPGALGQDGEVIDALATAALRFATQVDDS
jgi:sirohydrochlorin cobaltochelatase